MNPQKKELWVLDRLKSCKTIIQLKQIHALLIKTSPLRLRAPQLIYPKLISLCTTSSSSFGANLTYFRSILTNLENPHVILYNNAIKALSSAQNSSFSLEAVALFREMLIKGLVPDNYTVPYALKACAQSQALREGEQIHAHCIKTGMLLSIVYVKNTLMTLYAVCGVIKAVQKLFHGSPQRDLISWTTLFQGYVKMGFLKEGVAAFFEMCDSNLRADEMTLVIVLSACSKLGDLELGRKIHDYMRDNEVNSDVFVGNALVNMYLNFGDADFACKLFDEMPFRNVVACFYGWPEEQRKHELWQLLKHLHTRISTPWLCVGDYNEILSSNEKQGGVPKPLNHMEAFRATLLHYGLEDLGFQGNIFTWNNGRHGNAFVQERLDRACATAEWKEIYPETRVFHLQTSYSDHIPIVITTQNQTQWTRKRKVPRRFEEKWASNPQCETMTQETWRVAERNGSPMSKLFEKIKRCRFALVD
ncbi:pentatricopeptide repeat-containing protein At1g08070, chloroplastic-like [Quercus robur]|uniref:pentatricopeptide repeat-containing protein At1g08070, chloroplastic-like n=1 Tax=Quercus robur TaxID=38942 RepID=UPI0021633173|nr:pentatricopeptide repeat-containing protein At1g08070, chloroplastic-like [Quercus robur]